MRRKHVPGSVFFRPETEKWVGRRRWKDELGNMRERSFTCVSETDAWKKLAEFDRQLVRGLIVASAEMSFGEWTKEAMETIFKPKLRPSTYAAYDCLIRNHLYVLSNVKLSQLTVDMVEGLWNGKTKSVRKVVRGKTVLSSKPMGRATKHQIRRLVINILNHAVRRRKVKENVAQHTLIAEPAAPKIVRALTVDQVVRLLDSVPNPMLRTLFRTQVMLGLRIGEAVGLKWEDLEGNVLHVRRQVQRDRLTKALVDQPLKTHRSRRDLAVHSGLIEEWNRLVKDETYVFHTRNGTPIDPRNAQRDLYKAAKRAGLDGVSTHVLRHTYATLNVTGGTHINVISNALGHTHLSTTMIYAESHIAAIKEANDRVAALLAG